MTPFESAEPVAMDAFGNASAFETTAAVEPASSAGGTGLSLAPPAPRQLDDTGLDAQTLIELVAKVFYLRGSLRLVDLARQLRLPAAIVEEVLGFMRDERLIEILRRGASAGNVDCGLTEGGRARAAEYLRKCRYCGPAPVTLEEYAAQVRLQTVSGVRVTQAEIERAYADEVFPSEARELIGPAMNSGRAMFLYGPSGSGKTYLAESLVRLMRGTVYVPYALIVEGEIVQVFDPMIHRPVEMEIAHAGLDNRGRTDQRWLACARPVAISGGELTVDMLNLKFDPVTGYYQAPVHVKANNGLYIVDDLGRQNMRPEQLLNRWIVPMGSQRDFLSLHTGSTFEVPFDVKLLFSTNLSPQAIGDEAFLRRLGYKIFVGAVSAEEYQRIFRLACIEFDVAFRAETFASLRALHEGSGRPTLACYPRELISHVRDYATYHEWPVDLTPELIDWAWRQYFALDTGASAPGGG